MKSLAIAACILLLTACASSAPVAPTPVLSFTKFAPINLNVSRIEVIEDYKSPMHAPNVEHLMTYSPADAVQIWVKDRLRATGNDNLLQVNILDAKVIETALPRTKGIKGIFTVDQDKRYDARLEVQLRVYGTGTLSDADTTVTVTRTITIPENASVVSRNAAYNQMIMDLMNLLNAKLEGNINTYLGKYITTRY